MLKMYFLVINFLEKPNTIWKYPGAKLLTKVGLLITPKI